MQPIRIKDMEICMDLIIQKEYSPFHDLRRSLLNVYNLGHQKNCKSLKISDTLKEDFRAIRFKTRRSNQPTISNIPVKT